MQRTYINNSARKFVTSQKMSGLFYISIVATKWESGGRP
ncbi:hypothetical protein MNSC_03020 [Minisyncoccus archaeophilus]